MAHFKINDRHVAFCNAVAAGMEQYKAYQQYMSPGKKAGKMTAAANSYKLMQRPQIIEMIDRVKAAREAEITGVMTRDIGKEFSAITLTTDELDSFHYAVIQGIVEVEEVVPQWTTREVYDKAGMLKGRERVQSFVRVKRPPNVKEKQASVDAIYKRFGNYAPSRLFGAIKNINDEGELENVQRMIVFSNGEKMPLP